MGDIFTLKLYGLKPNDQAIIKAVSVDSRGVLWESETAFKADDEGQIDAGLQAPVSGGYAEADVLGLLWSMQPKNINSQRPPSYARDEANGWTVDFTVTDPEGRWASARLRRAFQRPGQGLVRFPLDRDGLHGVLYFPAQGGPFPAVLILGGSGGGLYEWLAQSFASNGFAALTLAYFNYRDLPKDLLEIPLEYFKKAAGWLKAHPAVRPDRIGLAGGSKGGELALLLGTLSRDFKAIVAWVPAAHVWQGISRENRDVSSWSLEGRGLPYVKTVVTQDDIIQFGKGEMRSVRHCYERGLKRTDPADIEQAAIPVKRIQAPVLIVSATDDQTWPSSEFAEAIMARLEERGHSYEQKHLRLEGAGHMAFLPFLIRANDEFMNGGNARSDTAGGFLAWKEMISFLHEYLSD